MTLAMRRIQQIIQMSVCIAGAVAGSDASAGSRSHIEDKVVIQYEVAGDTIHLADIEPSTYIKASLFECLQPSDEGHEHKFYLLPEAGVKTSHANYSQPAYTCHTSEAIRSLGYVSKNGLYLLDGSKMHYEACLEYDTEQLETRYQMVVQGQGAKLLHLDESRKHNGWKATNSLYIFVTSEDYWNFVVNPSRETAAKAIFVKPMEIGNKGQMACQEIAFEYEGAPRYIFVSADLPGGVTFRYSFDFDRVQYNIEGLPQACSAQKTEVCHVEFSQLNHTVSVLDYVVPNVPPSPMTVTHACFKQTNGSLHEPLSPALSLRDSRQPIEKRKARNWIRKTLH